MKDAIDIISSCEALLRQNKWNDTLSLSQQLLNFESHQASLWLIRGRVYRGLKQKDLALEALRKAVRLSSEQLFFLGHLALGLQNFNETIQKDDILHTSKGKKCKTPKDWLGRSYLEGALGNFESAVETSDNALKLDKAYAEAWDQKGFFLEKLNSSDKAVEAFNEALEIDPQYVDALIHKGKSLSHSQSIYCRALDV
ncbi:MAG: tetratricopeptide repeat protein [Solidesulfovibrio sp.]